jgi:hypothetical protein
MIQNQQNQKTEEEEEEQLYNQTRRSRKMRRILLVDDEPDLCMVYQIVLEDAGFECIHTQIQSKLSKNSDLTIMI